MSHRILRAIKAVNDGNYSLLLNKSISDIENSDDTLSHIDLTKNLEGVYESKVRHFNYISDYTVTIRYVFKDGIVTVKTVLSGRKYFCVPAYEDYEVSSTYLIVSGMLHYGSDLQGHQYLNPLPNGGVPYTFFGKNALLIMVADNQTQSHTPLYLTRIF